jgi:hypothetical protein
MADGLLASFQERPGLALGLGVGLFVLVAGGGFLYAQTRVNERPPTMAEHEAMVTLEDLVGQAPEGTGPADELVRAFPSMPMLWLNYRRSGPVQIRSHLLRYDDEALAKQGVERFATGDGQWVSGLALRPLPLPACVDGGSLTATEATSGEGSGFLLTAHRAGSYVHVSGTGWAPRDEQALARGLCPSLAELQALEFPPRE